MAVLNTVVSWYLRKRMPRIERFMKSPHEVQELLFKKLIYHARNTAWGRRYGYKDIKSPQQYANHVPIQDYETLKPYIEKMMMGEKDVLWNGKATWFSKSSGTTSDKSKYIPVPHENLRGSHIRTARDTLSLYCYNRPNTPFFDGKGLVMGGSHYNFDKYPSTKIGDVSAIMMRNMPSLGKFFHTPDMDTALMADWEPKIERIAQIASKENVTNIGGVPTWTIVLFRRILEITGKSNILEVWPNLQVYIHGGVSFTPYVEQFKQFLPSDEIDYLEIYNASEGYFGIQNDLNTKDMLLMLDNGIYYEFIPPEEFGKEFPKTVTLDQVEVGVNYALVISTNGGLWRYLPGDTVKFTSTYPYKIVVSGRTKHYINAFGEEVMVENTDKAIAMTCKSTGALVREYTVAPVYIKGTDGKGGHEWLVEFDKYPDDLNKFSNLLDSNLQKLNSDYEAKRYRDMALLNLKLRPMEVGTFYAWLKSKGKYGGQNKVPRLSNHRQYVDEILRFSRKIAK